MKRKKSSDQILLFLVKNSVPEYHIYTVSHMHDVSKSFAPNQKRKSKKEKLEDLLLSLSGTNRYICDSEKLEEFLGEKISFEKHLRKIHDAGILDFNGVPEKGSFYDSPNYRKNADHTNGQVYDYKIKKKWVAFHYKKNDFLNDYCKILEDAKDLGLL